MPHSSRPLLATVLAEQRAQMERRARFDLTWAAIALGAALLLLACIAPADAATEDAAATGGALTIVAGLIVAALACGGFLAVLVIHAIDRLTRS